MLQLRSLTDWFILLRIPPTMNFHSAGYANRAIYTLSSSSSSVQFLLPPYIRYTRYDDDALMHHHQQHAVHHMMHHTHVIYGTAVLYLQYMR